MEYTYININNLNIINYDMIVLDLDGTLIYSSNKNKGQGIQIKFKNVYKQEDILWVHLRPGFYDFLEFLYQHKCKIGIWSMGQPGYVEAITKLFPYPPHFIYNWCNCDRSNCKIFKDLNKIPHNGKILMIDDKQDILKISERVNTYIIPEWKPKNINDNYLYQIIS